MFIKIRAITDAPKEVIQKEAENHFVIYIREPAERNLANKRILEIMRTEYPNTNIKMIKGHRSPSKIVEIL